MNQTEVKPGMKDIKSLISYVFVGGGATLVEWAGFWLFSNICSMNYLFATSLAFIISTFANWALGRAWTFKGAETRGLAKEILSIYCTSILGLAFNLIIMRVMVGTIGIDKMLSKITATGIVFFYNYFVRKKIIYRKSA
jgi:putative flippase GtrA